MVVPVFSEILDEVLPVEAELPDASRHSESLVDVFGVLVPALDKFPHRFVP